MANVVEIVIKQSGQGNAIVEVTKSLGGIKGVGDTAISTLLNIGKALTGIGAVAATALIGFGASGVKAAMDVDHQLAQIAATLGTTKDAAMPLKQLMTDLALDPKLTVNVTQAGEAIEVLAANGLELQDILEGGARGAVQLANATGSDFATAATIATDAMQQFGFEADELGKVADGIAGVLVKSKFSADDYALALSNAGGIAGSLGVDMADFNTILAATSSQFSSGSDAGTSFKTLLTRLAKPTDEVAAAMQQYGISIFDAEGKMKPFAEIAGQLNKVFNESFTVTSQVGGATKEQAKAAEQASAKIGDLTRDIGLNNQKMAIMRQELGKLAEKHGADSIQVQNKRLAMDRLTATIADQQEKLAGYQSAISAVDGAQAKTVTTTQKLTEAQKAELATILGGTDAMRTILGLAEMNQEEFAALSAEVNKSGLASQAAATRVDSLTGAWEIFKGIIEAVQIQVGDKFLPLVRRVTEAVSVWASANSEVIVNFFGNIASGIDGVITAITKVSGAFQRFGLRGATVSILGQLGLDQDQISQAMGVFDQITTAIDKVMGAYDRFGARGAAVSILGQLGIDPETIGLVRTTFDTIIEKIGILQQIYTQFGAQGAGVSLLSMLGLSSETISLITTSIQSVVDGFNSLADWWVTTWPIIQAAALTGWEVLQGIFAGIQTALGPSLTQLQTQFSQVFTQISTLLSSFGISWSDVWGALLTATGIVAAGIGAAIVGIIGIVAGLATGIAEGISAAITMFQNLATNVAGIFTGLTTIFVGWVETFKALLAGDFAGAWEGFKIVLQGAVTFWTNMWGGMITVAVGTLDIITSTISGFVEGIVGFFQGMYDQLVGHSIIPDLINGIVRWFSGLPQKILAGLGNLKTKVTEPFIELGTTIKTELGDAITFLTDDLLPLFAEGFDTVTEGVKNFISSIREAASTLADMVIPDFLQTHSPPPLATAFNLIAGGANAANSAISGMMNSLASGKWSEIRGQVFDLIDDMQDEGHYAAMGYGKSTGHAIKQAFVRAFNQSFEGIMAGTISAAHLEAITKREAGAYAERVSGNFEKIIQTARAKGRELITAMQQELMDALPSIAGALSGLAQQFGDFLKPEMDERGAFIKRLQAFMASGSDELFKFDFAPALVGVDHVMMNRLQAQEQLNYLLAEQQKQEEQITKQKEAQQKVSFLQSQVDLIKQGRELGINFSDSISFGMHASAEDLLAATNELLNAMLGQIDTTLQIASPSKVMFEKFKNQVGGGMIQGLMAVRPALQGVAGAMLDPLSGGSVTNSRVTNNYFSQTVNTRAESSSVIGDFRSLQLMAGT